MVLGGPSCALWDVNSIPDPHPLDVRITPVVTTTEVFRYCPATPPGGNCYSVSYCWIKETHQAWRIVGPHHILVAWINNDWSIEKYTPGSEFLGNKKGVLVTATNLALSIMPGIQKA